MMYDQTVRMRRLILAFALRICRRTCFRAERPVVFFTNRPYDGFVCVDVLRPSQPNGVMSSAVSLPYHTFTGQA